MTTRKECTERYNTLASQLGLPTVKCLFRTLPIAQARVAELERRLAGHHSKMDIVKKLLAGDTVTLVAEEAAPEDTRGMTPDTADHYCGATTDRFSGSPNFEDADPIPAELKVENRLPLSPEQQARFDSSMRGTPRTRTKKRDFYQPKGMSDEEWEAHKRAQEKENKAAQKERLAALREKKRAEAPVGGSTHSRTSYDPASTIVVLCTGNPHRPTSKDHDKFAASVAAGTIGGALAAGADVGYLRYAERRGLIKIGD